MSRFTDLEEKVVLQSGVNSIMQGQLQGMWKKVLELQKKERDDFIDETLKLRKRIIKLEKQLKKLKGGFK